MILTYELKDIVDGQLRTCQASGAVESSMLIAKDPGANQRHSSIDLKVAQLIYGLAEMPRKQLGHCAGEFVVLLSQDQR